MKTRNWKRIISMGLAMCLTAVALLVETAQPAEAATASVPEAVHIYVGEEEENVIRANFVTMWDHIENLKTSSKNLAAEVTFTDIRGNGSNGISFISLYASKKGTYQVTFDIYNAKNKKVSSHSVKVYANKERPMKKITFAGKSLSDESVVTDLTKGKLSVSMNKGYTLTNIAITTYNQDGGVTKIAKNNSTIKLGTYAETSEDGQMYKDYYYLYTYLMAPTQITIFYTDKYTKQTVDETYYVYRIAK